MLKRRSKIKSFTAAALNMLAMVGLVVFIACMGERSVYAQSHPSDKMPVVEDHRNNASVTNVTVVSVKESSSVATVPAISVSVSKGKRTKEMIKIIFQIGLERRKVDAPAVARNDQKPMSKDM